MIDLTTRSTVYAFVPIFREQERKFWHQIAETLYSRYSTHVVISGLAVNQVEVIAHNFIALPLDYSHGRVPQQKDLDNLDQFQLLLDRFCSKATLWGESYSTDAIQYYASTISLHLKILNPISILIWNWHRPEGMLARAIAESMGIQSWDIERTPWPGMLSLDRNGQLSETNLAMSLASFSARHADFELSTNDDLKTYFKRGEEYVSRVMKESWTWWHQPGPFSSVAAKISGSSSYKKAKYRVLFAGQVDNDVQNFLFNPKYNLNITAFEAFIQALPDDSFVIGKHHPMAKSAITDYQKVIDKAEHVTGVWTADLDVEDAMSLADHVAAVNSSILFEAMFHRRSCFEMGQTMLSDLGVFYECKPDVDLCVAIEEWLSEPECNYSKRFQRFLVLTGFALSQGLLAFKDFALSFDEPNSDVFLGKWFNQLFANQESILEPSASDCLPIEFGNLANSLATAGLCHQAAAIGDLCKELENLNSLSVRKTAVAFLLSLKASFTRRITKFGNRLPRLSQHKNIQIN